LPDTLAGRPATARPALLTGSTPVTVNILSGLIASAFVFFAFLITNGSLQKFFAVMISLVISTTSVSYVFVFPALIALRRKYPDTPRPYRVPGGMAGAWIAAGISELFVVVTAIYSSHPVCPDHAKPFPGMPASVCVRWGHACVGSGPARPDGIGAAAAGGAPGARAGAR
jgi:amino acid transporter